MSTLTWLDFSDAERRRALQVVELLGRPEARDELGIATIRDAFSNALFPGMSTVQRRARYFLFVPWIFREVEERYRGHADPLRHTRNRELRLIETLLQGHDTDGVIGSYARRNLQQLPSLIYWNGLARWGVRTVEGTPEQWARSVQTSGERWANDDGEVEVREASWWDPNLVEPPDEWPDAVTLSLRPEEASYLRDRIRETCPVTLLATLAERRSPWPEVEFPWLLEVPELDERSRRILRYARWFSEVMLGAGLIYNRELARLTEADAGDLAERYERDLEEWVVDQERAGYSDTSLEEFWVLLRDLGSRHTERTKQFVSEWAARAADPGKAVRSSKSVDLIRNRELLIKGPKARLTHDAARETWRGAAGVGQLTYRWPSAQRQLLDIIEAGGVG